MTAHLDRITAVLREHREEIHEEGCCICGWHAGVEFDWPDHVAQKVAEALQLDRRETALAPADYPEAVYPETIGHAGRSFSEMTEVWPFPAMRPSDVVVVHRSATKWEVQE